MNSILKSWGWNDFFERQLQEVLLENSSEVLIPARITGEDRGQYRIVEQTGKLSIAELKGALKKNGIKPTVGDWVLGSALPGTDRMLVTHSLQRQTSLVRRESGQEYKSQDLAANVDLVFIVTSANSDFNLRRIERFLALIAQGGAQSAVVLSKTDLAENVDSFVDSLKTLRMKFPICPVSLVENSGLERVKELCLPGTTVALIGASGVGKSSLVNALGEANFQAVNPIQDNEKGRHTTTGRSLFLLQSGVCLLDTPGLREVGLWVNEETIENLYADITQMSLQCKFTNCLHEKEPGCAIQSAINSSQLTQERLEGYRKLQAEARFFERKVNKAAATEEKKTWKKIHMSMRAKKKLEE
ncbi:MAG: ribosome small subunit-dependent GTPase A [Bdellovibrionales bacterium]